MRRSTARTLESHEISTAETHFGIILTLAAFAVAANVCSAIVMLAAMP